MSQSTGFLIESLSDSSIAASHSPLAKLPLLVAPTMESHCNTLRAPLMPIACWSICDARFRFSCSFIVPEVADDLKCLAALVRGLDHKHKARPLASIFGHADPVGDEAFNKKLSGRRAAAVYGMLTRRTDIWEDIYSQHGKFTAALPGDTWGTEVLDIIFADLGYLQSGVKKNGDDHIKAFQRDAGLVEDGKPGPNTRRELFLAYMDKYSRTRKNEPFILDAEDFLTKGADKAHKGDYQGCSEFNPLFLYSEKMRKELSQPSQKIRRNILNEVNRRVVIYFFDPRTQIEPDDWPCPRATEGIGGCKKRLWSDATTRLKHSDTLRTFESTGDTFGCRFYESLALHSPCETADPFGEDCCMVGEDPHDHGDEEDGD